MNKNEWIEKIVKEIYTNTESQLSGFRGEEFELALNECRFKNLVRQKSIGSYFLVLETKGYEFAESGLTYEEWLKEKTNPNQSIHNHVGHVIHGGANHSDLSINALNRSIAPPINTQNKQSKISSIAKFLVKNIWSLLSALFLVALGTYLGLNKSIYEMWDWIKSKF